MRKYQKIKMYLKYMSRLLKHKYYVFVVGKKLDVPLWLRVIHDFSKFSPIEFFTYARNFCGDYTKSPLDRNVVSDEFLLAWLHHENLNKHHWGYWIPRSGKSANKPLPIPEIYIREMIADFAGASKAYTGNWDISKWISCNWDGFIINEQSRIIANKILKVFCAEMDNNQ